MDSWFRRPCEPKHANHEKYNANDDRWQPRFWNRLVVVLGHGLGVERLVGEVDKHSEQDADEYT